MNTKTRELRNSADKVYSDYQYMKKYSPDEITEMKSEFTSVSIELSSIEDEFDGIKETYKSKMKPIKVKLREFLKNIKNRARLVKEECYGIYDGDYVVISDSEGSEIERRPRTIDERQMTIPMNRVVNE